MHHLGPRNGLPARKPELQELASALGMDLAGKTVAELRAEIRRQLDHEDEAVQAPPLLPFHKVSMLSTNSLRYIDPDGIQTCLGPHLLMRALSSHADLRRAFVDGLYPRIRAPMWEEDVLRRLKHHISGTREDSQFLALTTRPLAALFFATQGRDRVPSSGDRQPSCPIVLVDARRCEVACDVDHGSARIFDTYYMKESLNDWRLEVRSAANIVASREISLVGRVPPSAIRGWIPAHVADAISTNLVAGQGGGCQTITEFLTKIQQASSETPPNDSRVDHEIVQALRDNWRGQLKRESSLALLILRHWKIEVDVHLAARVALQACYKKIFSQMQLNAEIFGAPFSQRLKDFQRKMLARKVHRSWLGMKRVYICKKSKDNSACHAHQDCHYIREREVRHVPFGWTQQHGRQFQRCNACFGSGAFGGA